MKFTELFLIFTSLSLTFLAFHFYKLKPSHKENLFLWEH